MAYHLPGLMENEKYGHCVENKKDIRNTNPYCQEFKFPREELFQKENVKKVPKEPVNPYRTFHPESIEDSREFDQLSSGRH